MSTSEAERTVHSGGNLSRREIVTHPWVFWMSISSPQIPKSMEAEIAYIFPNHLSSTLVYFKFSPDDV